MYYRKDIFEENGRELAEHLGGVRRDRAVLTDEYGPEIYGAAFFRQAGYVQFMSRSASGRWRQVLRPRDHEGDLNSEAGVKAFQEMRDGERWMPAGVETWGASRTSPRSSRATLAMTTPGRPRALVRGLRHRQGGAVVGPEIH